METFLEELTPVSTEEHEFKHWDELFLLTIFGNSGLWRPWYCQQNQYFLNCLLCQKQPPVMVFTDEIKPVVMERWKVWNSSFLETIGTFFAFPVYQDSKLRKNKTTDFSKDSSCENRKLPSKVSKKKLNVVFFEENEMQHRGFWKVFARFPVPSMWESQSEMFQQKRSWCIFVPSDNAELEDEK